MCVGAVCVHDGVGYSWGGAAELHLFCLLFIEAGQRLGLVCLFSSFFFFFPDLDFPEPAVGADPRFMAFMGKACFLASCLEVAGG